MENLNKSALDCRGGTQRVKMGGISSSERFQAQAIWEMSFKADSFMVSTSGTALLGESGSPHPDPRMSTGS